MAEGSNAELTSGDDVRTGVAWIGTTLKQVEYTAIDGLAVVEGCIILGSVEKIEALTRVAPDADKTKLERFGISIKGPQYRWPNKTVVYQIDVALPEPQRVTDAVAHWETKTSLQFVQRTEQDRDLYPNYIVFRPGSGCGSAVGCQGGEQFITLGADCTMGNAIHEIGHAVGLWHEQSRSDRDQWIDIRIAKVASRHRHNFSQHIHDGVDMNSYDYGSIMHYPKDAFSIDGSDTIVPKNGAAIGQRDGLSAGDIAAVAVLYP